MEEGTIDPPAWEHEDIDIVMPSLQHTADVIQEAKYTIEFDGGCRKKLGSGGYVVREGETLRAAVFVYYGTSRPTNNKAEMQAAVDAMEAF